MKKIILFLAGILLTGAITAQNDTAVVSGKPEKYFANFYPPEDWMTIESLDQSYINTAYQSAPYFAPGMFRNYRAIDSVTGTAPVYTLQQFHTDHPIKIIGAALWTNKEIKGDYEDSVLLYDADSDGNLTYLWGRACDPWAPDSLKLVYDNYGYLNGDFINDICNKGPIYKQLCMHEYYMSDTASVIVEDTFYLGFTYWNNNYNLRWGEPSPIWYKAEWAIDIRLLTPENYCTDDEWTLIPKMYSMDGHTWQRSRDDYYIRDLYMIWPIIDVEYGQDTIDSVSVGRVETVEEIKVSPNPARERVSVEASRVIDHLWVKNTQGVEIYNNTHCTNRVELNVNWWPKGVYILYMQLDGDPVLHARKLVVE